MDSVQSDKSTYAMKFWLEAFSTKGVLESFFLLGFNFHFNLHLIKNSFFFCVITFQIRRKIIFFQFLAHSKDRIHSSGETEAEPVINKKKMAFMHFFLSKWKIGLNFLMFNVEHY